MSTTPNRSIWIDRIVWVALASCVITDVGSGVVRYLLQQIGAVELAYVPKVLACILSIILIWRSELFKVTIPFTIIICIACIWGLANSLPSKQVAFGLWILAPVYFGILAWGTVQRNPSKFLKLCLAAALVSTAGVLINSLTPVPWTDSSFVLAGHTIENAREWSMLEINRPAGFARLSSQAAIQIGLFALIVAVVLRERMPKTTIVFIAFGLAGIVASTTKTAVAAFALIALILIPKSTRLLYTLCYVLLITAAVLPVGSLIYDFSITSNNWVIDSIVRSLDQRLTYTWPSTIGLLDANGTALLGRGLGGLGTGEKLFGFISSGEITPILTTDLSVSDNYALYLYGNFGVFGVYMLVMQYTFASRLVSSHYPIVVGIGTALIYILFVGLATDSIECLSVSILIGIALAAASSPVPRNSPDQ